MGGGVCHISAELSGWNGSTTGTSAGGTAVPRAATRRSDISDCGTPGSVSSRGRAAYADRGAGAPSPRPGTAPGPGAGTAGVSGGSRATGMSSGVTSASAVQINAPITPSAAAEVIAVPRQSCAFRGRSRGGTARLAESSPRGSAAARAPGSDCAGRTIRRARSAGATSAALGSATTGASRISTSGGPSAGGSDGSSATSAAVSSG